jgi:hypothetical protein
LEIFKRRNPDKITIEMANMIMDNSLHMFRFWKPYKFEGDLSWTEDPYNDKTWCFYLHSLEMVGILAAAYESTNKIEYLKKAKWYIQSWIDLNFPENNAKSQWAWKPHSVANRLVNILHFYWMQKDTEEATIQFTDILKPILIEHGDFLADSNNYEDYNHGIFQDQALMELAVFFKNFDKSSEWLEISRRRLKRRLDIDFTESGVHREHSPGYHIIVMNLFINIKKFMDYHKVSYFDNFKGKLWLMQDYLAYAIKEDGNFPLIGDTGNSNVLKSIKKEDVINEHLLYRITNGNEGVQLEKGLKLYEDAGVSIYNNDSIYWAMVNSFNSKTHKHADDLSFTLTFNNKDYFIDSGKYNYKEDDHFRKYFRSAFAHNTIVVNDESYELKVNQIGNSGFMIGGETANYCYVQAFHKLYSEIMIIRTIIYTQYNAILVHDRVYSNSINNYKQIFNIGKDIELNIKSQNSIVLTNSLNSDYISLKQLNKTNNLYNLKGEEDPVRGWQSFDLNEKHPIDNLQFELIGDNIEFITLININNENKIQDVKITPSSKDSNLYKFYNDKDEVVLQSIIYDNDQIADI